MNKEETIFGNTYHVTGKQAIHQLEPAISEGVIGIPSLSVPNLFGRTVSHHPDGALASAIGLASTGLRVGAFIEGDELVKYEAILADASRRQIPIVVNGTFPTHQSFLGSGYFQLCASSVQEVVDLNLIAHRIAERALIPGIVWMNIDAEQPVIYPEKSQILEFLGDPDGSITCPTPAQEMVFGKHRRRIPNWFHFDIPVMTGAHKSTQAQTFETAARKLYQFSQLPALIREAMTEFSNLTGRNYAPVSGYYSQKAKYVIIARGNAFGQVRNAIDQLRAKGKKRIGGLNLHVLNPFTMDMLEPHITGKKGITVLHQIKPGTNTATEKIHSLPESAKALRFDGYYSGRLAPEDVLSAIDNMLAGLKGKSSFYLGIDFSRPQSRFPRHEVLLHQIRRHYPHIESETIAPANHPKVSSSDAESTHEISPIARHYEGHGPPYARLSTFYDHIGYFYQAENTDELVADPFQALPSMPAGAGHLANQTQVRTQIPVLQAEKCTGCGACFVQCPYAALPAIAINVEALLKAGIKHASDLGTPLTGLTPLVRNLSLLIGKRLQNTDGAGFDLSGMLSDAFEAMRSKTKWKPEKQEQLAHEMAGLSQIVSTFPIAATARFFQQPEAKQKGSGNLFSLAVDPYACTGCGICADVCPEDALEMAEETTSLVDQAKDRFSLWDALPPTPESVLSDLQKQKDYNPFAAVLLDRKVYRFMGGGSTLEGEPSFRTLVHLIGALTQSIVSPRFQIQQRMIGKLLESLESATSPNGTEKDQNRKSLLREDLHLLDDMFMKGYNGMGRAPFGLVFSPHQTLTWAASYPNNLFTTPAVIGLKNQIASQVMGLIQGHIRHAIDNLRLIRRATLEAKDRYDPTKHSREIADLSWTTIRNNEKGIVPPILWIADAAEISASDQEGILNLLVSDLPVKIVLLNNGKVPDGISPDLFRIQQSTLLFAAQQLPGAPVFQASIKDMKGLFDGLKKGLSSHKPALFYLLTDETQQAASSWPDLAAIVGEMNIGKTLTQSSIEAEKRKSKEELNRLKKEYETKIKQLEQDYLNQVRGKLRENLKALIAPGIAPGFNPGNEK